MLVLVFSPACTPAGSPTKVADTQLSDTGPADSSVDSPGTVGGIVGLDGSASTVPEGGTLGFAWSLASVPTGSGLDSSDIVGATEMYASFTPDWGGVFVLGLVVTDGVNSDGPAYCSVTVPVGNEPPVADAGSDITAASGDTVQLEGRGRYDPEGESPRPPSPMTWSVLTFFRSSCRTGN